jgi:hypothetical protein
MARLRLASWLIALAAAGACTSPPPAAEPPAASPAPAPPTFENRVWRVAESSAVAPGQLYVFLSEGTLVIASPNNAPMVGRWARRDGGLTMVEEGREYATDILALTEDEFRIRSHNPGQPVDIRLVPADRPASRETP